MFQKNLIISKSATICHFSSIMTYGIGRACKLRKQNRKRLHNTTDPYSEPSTPSYSYDRLNENTDSNTNVVLPPHNDGSQSYETPRKNNCRSYSFGGTLSTTITP